MQSIAPRVKTATKGYAPEIKPAWQNPVVKALDAQLSSGMFKPQAECSEGIFYKMSRIKQFDHESQ